MKPQDYIKFRFEIDGDVQLSRAFDTMGVNIQDLSEGFREIVEDFHKHMTLVFQFEGAHEGRERWAPLSHHYKLWKDVHYPGKKILQRTERLKDSLTNKYHPGSIVRVEKLQMTVGTSVGYAKKHQTGDVMYHLPQRKIIELTDVTKKRWTGIIHKHISKQAVSVWGKVRPKFR